MKTKYKVTLEVRGEYEMEIENEGSVIRAAEEAEKIFNNRTNYKPNIQNYIGEVIRVERIES